MATGIGAAGSAPFVGREAEIGTLLAALADAASGQGRILLIGGEPGVGKTRLVDEFSGRAEAEGVLVLWGRCWEAGGAPTYWPWIQSIRGLVHDLDPQALRTFVAGGGPDLAQMFPEVREVLPDLPNVTPGSPEAARFRLFDSVSGFLARASVDQPLHLVLEDLHAADASSLLLLQFVADQIARSRMLIVGTYRDVEVSKNQVLASLLPELIRAQRTTRVSLSGLTKPDVARLIETITTRRPPDDFVTSLHRETQGNPFFVSEVVSHLASEDRLWGQSERGRWPIPESVREVIARRVGRLSAPCMRLLTLASVLGPHFTLEALTRAAGDPAEQVLESVQEAIASKLITEAPGSRGAFRFAHALIRDALYEDLGPADRVRLHRMVGEALEALYSYSPDPHLAELAYHFAEAARGGDGTKAVGYARRAGDRAASLLAYEEAVRLYQMAIHALDVTEPANPGMRCELLLAMGDAQARAGGAVEAKETFRRAADLARKLGMPEMLAQAALGYGGRFVWARAANDRHVVPLLQDALAALGSKDTVLRARVLARLAGALRDQLSSEPRISVSKEAVAIGRRIGDPATLAYTLDGRYSAIWNPDTVDERFAIADEIIRLSEQTGDMERAFQGRHYRMAVLIERGDVSRVVAELQVNSRFAEELHQPAQQWYVAATRAIIALLEGRFAESEELIEDTFAIGRQAESMHARGVFLLQTYALRREQERLEDIERLMREAVPDYTFWPWMQVVLMHLHAAQGRRSEVAREYDRIAMDNFTQLPFDNDWLFGMTHVVDVTSFLGDAQQAAELYSLLRPYAGRNAFGHPEYCTGSVDRSLGVLAAMMDRSDEAVRHFEAALDMNARMGARPWVAHTQHAYARFLAERSRRKDGDLAVKLLADALETSEEIGMTVLAERVRASLAEFGVRPRRARPRPQATGTFATLTRREREVAALVAEGRSNRHIAEKLFVSERTAEAHVQNILIKLGFTSRTQVAGWAVREGLLNDDT